MKYRFYDFTCDKCKIEERHLCSIPELNDQKCTQCGGDLLSKVEKTVGQSANVIPFKAGWYEHFALDPVYIGNKQDLKDACEKHNMGSAYRDDM